MNFNESPKFRKELKRLSKKYKTLREDVEVLCKVLSYAPFGDESKDFNIISQGAGVSIIKARFFCRYLRRSSLRIVYAYIENKERIDFIEMYFKGEKENEDTERVREYLKRG